ncbi:glycosyltransferase family 1 protein [Zobellella endophytica]|uniref:Glycosyltransferase family 1 protein n=1 Tax=Zobellella endophytica TaxID=2116700 RepID=A0A2P7R411_9GAMM|nr:glycosyltransferase family 4 protein [Zobellella endophytica]PSJ44954.1 glycosyltransferase family 1 protein [Zobellella endophytica]
MNVALIGVLAKDILNFRKGLIEDLVENSIDVFVFSIDYTVESKESIFKLGATPISYDFDRTGTNPIKDIINTLALKEKIKSVYPDVVLSFSVKPVIFGTLAAKLAGVKKIFGMLEGLGYVFTEQPTGLSSKVRFLRFTQIMLYRSSIPFLEIMFFLNHDDVCDLVRKYGVKIHHAEVLGGIGVDFNVFSYSKPNSNEVSFLFIGRLLKEKGINEFIESALLVREKYPEATFKILGGLDNGNPGGLSNSDINDLIRKGAIEHFGYVSNVSEYIAKSSVFVLPSYREGFPRSTQEAMAIGRPVITTDVPGCRETVVDGVNGFLVPPWSAEAIAEKMIYFIENREKIEEMGLASYKMAKERFDVRIVNKKLMKMMGL